MQLGVHFTPLKRIVRFLSFSLLTIQFYCMNSMMFFRFPFYRVEPRCPVDQTPISKDDVRETLNLNVFLNIKLVAGISYSLQVAVCIFTF